MSHIKWNVIMNGEQSINFREQNCSKENLRLLWNQEVNHGLHNPTTGLYPQQGESNLHLTSN
jgi:hypothetical protein